MLTVFTELFGPYPFDRYSAVITADELEIPLEAQTLSTFGANHAAARLGERAAGRPRTGPPVVRQQPHRRHLGRHLAARGIRLLQRMAVVRGIRVAAVPTRGFRSTIVG